MRHPASRTALCLLLAAPLGVGLACSEGTGSEDAGIVCEYGEGLMCECPNGQPSVSWCRLDGSDFLPCECEAGDEGFGEGGDGDGDPTTGDGDGDPTTGDGDGDGAPNFDEVCYPGPAEDYSVCFPIITLNPVPADYDYPAPYQGNVNYREPQRYLDLDSINASAAVAPNFTLDEFAQSWKGRYAVVQPHAVERVQDLRNALGAISVNSGYRNPGYNASIGGATYSRHMYGDAFDLDPINATLTQLEAACTQNAGFLVEYETHVHCDWRGLPVDVQFFGLPDLGGPILDAPKLDAELRFDEQRGEWLAPASGFDEGEPLRRWSAYDADGRLLVETQGRTFVPPPGAVEVEVIVGAQVRLRSP